MKRTIYVLTRDWKANYKLPDIMKGGSFFIVGLEADIETDNDGYAMIFSDGPVPFYAQALYNIYERLQSEEVEGCKVISQFPYTFEIDLTLHL